MRFFKTIFFLSVAFFFLAFTLELDAQNPSPSATTPDKKSVEQNLLDDEIISTDTSLVNIPVSVFDKSGRVITNLTKNNFRIYENGVEQRIENFASVEEPFTVVMLLDISGSMRFHLDDIKKAALAFVEQLKPNDRVVAIAFDNHLQVLSTDLLDREKLRKGIKNLSPGRGTFLYASIEIISNRLLRRFPGRKALLLFTDGVDSWRGQNSDGALPRANYQTSLRAAENSNALIYCVQFYPDNSDGNRIADAYLADLAALSGGNIYRPKKIKELQPAFVSIAEDLRWQYSLGFYPETRAKANERRQIKVVVDQPNAAEIRARESYVGK